MDLQSLILRISRSENLPVLPTVVIQILRLYEDPNVSPRSLEKVIEQDAALTAKILRVAGSSMYGSSSVTSVGRALSVLGMNTLRSIAISLGYQQILSTKGPKSSFDRVSFWRHCLAVGVGARAIGKMMAPNLAEELYVTGLIHDIGILTMDRFIPGDLDMVIRKAQVKNVSFGEAETEILGFNHGEVGGHLGEKWKLSQMTTNAIRFHHCPHDDPNNPLSTAIIVAANHLSYQLGYPAMPNIPGDPEGQLHFNELGLSEEQIALISEMIVAEVEQADQTYGDKRAA